MARKRKSGGGGIGCMGIFVVVALVSCLSHGGESSSSSSPSSSSIDSNASSVTNSSTSTPSTTTKSSDTTTSSQPTTPAPQPAPAPAPAPAQQPAPAPQKPQAQVKIVSIESPVPRNGTETVVAQVPPGTTASIEVDYASGPSHAAGLEDKTADASGRVSWSWHVGGRTTLGSWPVTVSDDGASDQASFEVVH